MYEILVYLFENYQHPAAFPGDKALFRKLSAVGFDNTDIHAALNWLSDVKRVVKSLSDLNFSQAAPFRIFSAEETKRLTLPCQNFLYFLENANILEPVTRELIIAAVMSLKDIHFDVDKLKVVTLITLWLRDQMPDTLLIDELLGEQPSSLH